MAENKKQEAARLEERVRGGLEKLAFGDIGDAVRLLLLEGANPEEAAKLDLCNIAELKYGKNGFEVKFFDRFRAMEALGRIAENDGRAAAAVPFFEALSRGAEDEPEEGMHHA